MRHFIKELKKLMSAFLDAVEAEIAKIPVPTAGVDGATVDSKIAAAVTPLQTQVTDQASQIADTQKAVVDLVAKLNTAPAT